MTLNDLEYLYGQLSPREVVRVARRASRRAEAGKSVYATP